MNAIDGAADGLMHSGARPSPGLQANTRAARRIAIVLPDLRPGGAERMHVHLAREWRRRGLDVDFVLQRARGELLQHLPEGCGVVDLAAVRLRGILVPLVRYLRDSPPDALLAAMWPLTVLAPLAARLARSPTRVIVSEHTPLSIAHAARGPLARAVMRASQRCAYPLADERIAVSQAVAEDLAAMSGISRDRFVVVANAAAGAATPGLAAADWPHPGPLLLAVGTLKRVKRHDLLIDAFARLPCSLGARLCILGEGPERADLEDRILHNGLAGRVVLHGHVDAPGPWYARADLFVLASDHEGFGNVLVEAMEHGLRIVSTDCPGGPREVLDRGRYGRLVPPGDPQALADAMVESLSTPVDALALRERAREYDISRVAARYLELLLPEAREAEQR
ncbi:MAG TPA: glycosyltransferase [Dokdonella sp.]